jgi:DNA-damage-inducible protein D
MSTDLVVPDDALVFAGDDGDPFTTSLVIAEQTGNEHASIIKLVRDNGDDLNDVGTLRFQIAKSGGRPTEFAVLDEPAAALLMTYLRNTPKVKDFKKRLVVGFYTMRQMLTQARPALPDITTPDGLLALTEMFSDTAKQLVAAQAEKKMLEAAIERDAPLVAKAEAHTVSDSAIHRQEFSREVKTWAQKQNVVILQDEVMRFLGHIGLFIRGERSDTGHATSEAIRRGLAFTDKGTSKKNGHAYAVGKLTPLGQDYAWKRITKYVAEHGHLVLPRELRGGDPA